MTINALDASRVPLTTDRDRVARVRDLLAPATHPSQLWVLFLDDEDHQTPVLIPLTNRPAVPDPRLVDGLVGALAALITGQRQERDDPGTVGSQVMFVLERFGPRHTTADDRRWAAALTGACVRSEVVCAGVFLLSRTGVSAVVP